MLNYGLFDEPNNKYCSPYQQDVLQQGSNYNNCFIHMHFSPTSSKGYTGIMMNVFLYVLYVCMYVCMHAFVKRSSPTFSIYKIQTC